MMDTADRRLQIAAAREGFLTSGTARASAVPDVVAASWRRSLTAGVDAETSEAVFYPDLDTSSRLVRCSRPIIERLSSETCLLYTSDAADEEDSVDLGGRRIIKKKKKKNNYI